MICFPNAKINLGLNIVSRREDGYHNLETIFYPVPIKDALEIIVREEQADDILIEEGIKIDADSNDNLVIKALGQMRSKYNFPSLEVHLLKKIPFGAGLGGGSADASFMLRLINDKFNLGASNEELASIAVRLGADCSFFIYNRPVFASGIGEIFEDIELSLSGYYFVLVKPDIYVSTKDAFGQIIPARPKISLKEIARMSIKEWDSLMINDFERSVFHKYPQIGKLKDQLYQNGAIYASMSGSGSSVYGIFEYEVNLKDNFSDYYYWSGWL